MADSPPVTNDTVPQHPPVVVKKYANRRLYNTETSSYITLENLAEMVRLGRDFVVYDAKSSEDITRSVLTQIIVEEESKGTSMLPTNFLRQLIGFYGDSLQGVVPRYLESAMSNFARQQQQMRQVMQQTFSPFLPMGVEEMGRQNIALMERAMAMFNPFARPGDTAPKPAESPATPVPPAPPAPELDAMRHEIEALRAQLAIARAETVMAQSAPQPAPPPAPVAAPLPASPAAPVLVSITEPAPAALALPRKVRVGRKPG
jgi:polyhydroxyalkanoate synthesis repressor PhaR